MRFADRVARSPQQVVRYAYGGQPLWSAFDPPKEDMPPCACGESLCSSWYTLSNHGPQWSGKLVSTAVAGSFLFDVYLFRTNVDDSRRTLEWLSHIYDDCWRFGPPTVELLCVTSLPSMYGVYGSCCSPSRCQREYCLFVESKIGADPTLCPPLYPPRTL